MLFTFKQIMLRVILFLTDYEVTYKVPCIVR